MRYDSYKMPDGRTTVRPRENGSSGQEQILAAMNRDTTLTPTDGKAVFTYLAEYLASELARGRFVTIDGIGTFGVSLGVDPDRDESSMNGNEVHIKRVTFRAARSLKQRMAEKFRSERVAARDRNASTPRYSLDARRAVIQGMLARHTEFTSDAYRAEAMVGRATAHRDLHLFESEGLLTSHRVGNTKLYHRP